MRIAGETLGQARSPKMRLTADWASSKLPSTAATCTLEPACVVICSSWTWETLPSG